MKKKQTKITRKEAIKKFGKYAAMTAVGTFIVLNPQNNDIQDTVSDSNNKGGHF